MATIPERAVTIPAGGLVQINGDLAVPDSPAGVVVFAHGSGSGRHSPRNRMVAQYLQGRRLATLLIDLLTDDEESIDMRTRQLRFDVEMLAGRLAAAASWCRAQPQLSELQIGYFGASTGAAAALIAAADQPEGIGAIVSRGGRPDLAGDRLAEVGAPTLLIVGGRDREVLDLNRQAERLLNAETRLEVVPGATHLFEERGALEKVSELAGDFLLEHLPAAAG